MLLSDNFTHPILKDMLFGTFSTGITNNITAATIATFSSTMPINNSKEELVKSKDPNMVLNQPHYVTIDGSQHPAQTYHWDHSSEWITVNSNYSGGRDTYQGSMVFETLGWRSPARVAYYGDMFGGGNQLNISQSFNITELADNTFSSFIYDASATAQWAEITFYRSLYRTNTILVPVTDTTGNGIVKVDSNNNLIGFSIRAEDLTYA